jgi:hypothetical protein
MNLFRSEEHLRRWLDGRPPGATLSVDALCALAHAWWGNRLDTDWRPRSRAESEAILLGLGLVDDFWTLPR